MYSSLTVLEMVCSVVFCMCIQLQFFLLFLVCLFSYSEKLLLSGVYYAVISLCMSSMSFYCCYKLHRHRQAIMNVVRDIVHSTHPTPNNSDEDRANRPTISDPIPLNPQNPLPSFSQTPSPSSDNEEIPRSTVREYPDPPHIPPPDPGSPDNTLFRHPAQGIAQDIMGRATLLPPEEERKAEEEVVVLEDVQPQSLPPPEGEYSEQEEEDVTYIREELPTVPPSQKSGDAHSTKRSQVKTSKKPPPTSKHLPSTSAGAVTSTRKKGNGGQVWSMVTRSMSKRAKDITDRLSTPSQGCSRKGKHSAP